ncbi:MAG: AMP-binding protein [Thermodesulfobacteriota bacterium]
MNHIYDKRVWLKNYPTDLPADLTLPPRTGLDLFENAAADFPERPALHYFDATFTYGRMEAMSAALAAGLAERGVRRGDRVILQLQNIPQYLISLYAIWKLGAVAVILNPMYKSREMEFYCRDSGAETIITMESCYGEVAPLPGKTPLRQVFTTSEMDLVDRDHPLPGILSPSIKQRIDGALDLLTFLAHYQGRAPDRNVLSPGDAGFLTYTSGTTGPPKGAINTHANIVFSANVYRRACRLGPDDVVLGVAPFFHITGSIGHLAVSALAAIPVVAFYRFDPGEMLRLIEKWRATMTIAPLTVFVALLNHPEFKKYDLSSLTTVMSGGAAVPEAFVRKFEESSGIYIHNWYGLTETTSPAVITPIGARSPVDPDTGALSIGVPVPNTLARIVDVKTEQVLPVGEIGELVVKGPMVVPGYWEKPEETAKALRDGWLYTGDVGKMDSEGWFYLVDRKKDLINASGYKVWPREVEDVLYQHPAVKEACVIGIPDPYRGETVKAYVILVDSGPEAVRPEELIRFCQERMAAYKYPRLVEIVDALPKTLSGKILKREIRARTLQR